MRLRRIRFAVTADRIARGRPLDAHWCPVALAIAETLKVRRVTANRSQVLIDGLLLDAPLEVTTFIDAYDTLSPVEPFEFELEVP